MSGKIVASLPRSRFSPAIPPLAAVVACVIWAGTARTASGIIGPAPPFVLPVFVLVMVTLAVAGAATPLPLISGAVPVRRARQAMLVAVAASVPFVFALLINPGQWERGDALPLVADSVPVFGWLLDGIMTVLPLTAGTPVYSLLFSAFGVFGFYLECVLVATVIYAVLRLTAAPAPGLREERHTEEEG
ncbi:MULTISPECIES: hypothetical protein [Methanoculleus]|uniref:Uncharacterized protein n=2 Tax=Methanoculleus TaxID=45989 RepID=A3CRL6_METMJ|nr:MULTISPECIES: hypothetical protein [Methanoculleus]ABN56016.1 hypothetical protein Memar_0081 [Methanoculleus marisnigri JR1]UYU17496.1 hypothetical protein OH143_07195 [Methanoculleus submarinus]